jgi:hypothetical protein
MESWVSRPLSETLLCQVDIVCHVCFPSDLPVQALVLDLGCECECLLTYISSSFSLTITSIIILSQETIHTIRLGLSRPWTQADFFDLILANKYENYRHAVSPIEYGAPDVSFPVPIFFIMSHLFFRRFVLTSKGLLTRAVEQNSSPLVL